MFCFVLFCLNQTTTSFTIFTRSNYSVPSPGEGNGYPLQYFGLENSLDCTIHGVAKSQTRLIDFHLPFPGSSAGIKSTLNAGDPGSIPGSGRSPGEGIGYPLQYSWSSLVAQTVKNLPAMQETPV